MTLTHIFIFVAAAAIYLTLLPKPGRHWALFTGSIIALYWLQPPLRILYLDFIFPTATIALVFLAWLTSRAPDQTLTCDDILSALVSTGLVLLLSLDRYLLPDYRVTASFPPAIGSVGLGLACVFFLLMGFYVLPLARRRTAVFIALLILVLFAILKTEPLALEASRLLRGWQGQSKQLARAKELEWLGFSYVAFRLIHTLRDRQSGKLPVLSLREYVIYVLFFPSLTAGPIDRAERFLQDLQHISSEVAPSRLVQGGMRIAIGIGKKFVIADSLAYFALNSTKAGQATTTAGVWVLLYAYAFQIYFDFSGYSDIAIGLGQLFGFKLPENFSQPYLKRNITLFWQSWHITLSQWVRFYVFSPLTRFLLMRPIRPSPTVVALMGQMTTMLVIGLWHGVTWGFVAWGLWHGTGLFIHKVWSDRTRPYYIKLRNHPRLNRIVDYAGIVMTFHFVVIGWVWFALPGIDLSWNVLLNLFGI